jgi:hypothetical protein
MSNTNSFDISTLKGETHHSVSTSLGLVTSDAVPELSCTCHHLSHATTQTQTLARPSKPATYHQHNTMFVLLNALAFPGHYVTTTSWSCQAQTVVIIRGSRRTQDHQRPWILGALIYKRVKLRRREDLFVAIFLLSFTPPK